MDCERNLPAETERVTVPAPSPERSGFALALWKADRRGDDMRQYVAKHATGTEMFASCISLLVDLVYVIADEHIKAECGHETCAEPTRDLAAASLLLVASFDPKIQDASILIQDVMAHLRQRHDQPTITLPVIPAYVLLDMCKHVGLSVEEMGGPAVEQQIRGIERSVHSALARQYVA